MNEFRLFKGGKHMVSTPWGSWEILLEESTYKVKRLIIQPKQMLSLQYHKYRNETWTVVSGVGVFWIGKEPLGGMVGDHFEIEFGVHHRIINPNDDPLIVIEVATGICDELDIVRLDDIYGRNE